MRTGIWAGIIVLLIPVISQVATTLAGSGTTVEPLVSLEQVEQIVRDTQWQF